MSGRLIRVPCAMSMSCAYFCRAYGTIGIIPKLAWSLCIHFLLSECLHSLAPNPQYILFHNWALVCSWLWISIRLAVKSNNIQNTKHIWYWHVVLLTNLIISVDLCTSSFHRDLRSAKRNWEGTVASHIKILPVTLASHKCAGLHHSCSTYPAPCPGK